MKITLNDLKEKPCKRYSYLYDKYSMDTEFDPIEEIEEIKKANPNDIGSDVAWLIRKCPKSQTPEMLEYYKGLDITDKDARLRNSIFLLINFNVFQTQENFEWYKSLEPSFYDVRSLIGICKVYQTKENFEWFMSLEPDEFAIEGLIYDCKTFKEWYESVN